MELTTVIVAIAKAARAIESVDLTKVNTIIAEFISFRVIIELIVTG